MTKLEEASFYVNEFNKLPLGSPKRKGPFVSLLTMKIPFAIGHHGEVPHRSSTNNELGTYFVFSGQNILIRKNRQEIDRIPLGRVTSLEIQTVENLPALINLNHKKK